MEALTATEIHAVNLQGGIHAWSSAWTKAQVPLCRDDVGQVVQVRRNGKGCLSYLVVSNGVAAVFDASVAADVYVGLAKECAASIKYVFETHIHADHVSRGSALAARVGAEYLLPVTQRYYGACGYVGDGETLSVGSLDVTVHSTPGHTSESVSYLISDSVLLTGDTLFLDSVGRPDLERGDAGAEEGARKLYATLHDKLLSLSDQVLVCPAHSAASIGFDGVPLVRELADIRNSISLLGFSEEVFVETILSGLGSKPNNHLHVIEVNQGQRTVVDTDLLHLEVGPNRCAAC